MIIYIYIMVMYYWWFVLHNYTMMIGFLGRGGDQDTEKSQHRKRSSVWIMTQLKPFSSYPLVN